MSEEIKAAAERLAKFCDGFMESDERDQYRLSEQDFQDTRILVRAWHQQYPADQDEPIDKTWLRTIGAEKDDHPEKFTFFRVDDTQPVGIWNIGQGQWKAVLRMQGNWSVTIARGLTTRGDLRQLCKSLSIPLPEPGAS